MLSIPAIWLTSGRGVVSSFQELEDRRAREDVDRVVRAIKSGFYDFHNKSVDWANWDDTYQFMQDRNPGYLQSNMDPVSFATMGVNYLCLVDVHGRLVHATEVPSKKQNKRANLPAKELINRLHSEGILKAGIDAKSGVHGVIQEKGVPLLVSVREIHKSGGLGPSRGHLIFCRAIDDSFTSQISSTTQQNVKIALGGSESQSGIALSHVSPDRIEGLAFVEGLSSHTKLEVEVFLGRRESALGLAAAKAAMVSFVLICALGILLLVVLLEKRVLGKIDLITTQLKPLSELEHSSGIRVSVPGSDEFGQLAKTINNLLISLDDDASELRASEEELRSYNDLLEAKVDERTKKLEHLALHDKLTGLPNRALFINRLEFAVGQCKREPSGLATLFIDLDNFKLVNDTMGHDMGDSMLRTVSERLIATVRPGDTVSRLGGDEFTILLTQVSDLQEVTQIVERILVSLQEPIALQGRDVQVGGSIGVSFSHSGEIDPVTMLKQADTAMYRAKAEGKNAYRVFDEYMQDLALARLRLETGLKSALRNNEVSVVYQPLISLATGETVGAEALARWNHPVNGQIPPSEFIPVAEDTGEIITIGYWILEEACRQTKEWIDSGYPPDFQISVNVSGRQLQRADVVQRVNEILDRTKLPAKNLKLEITESTLMEDREEVIEKMKMLKELGLQLALDDFGTGYSSLSTLRLFPIDTLKIDRAFISRLGEEEGATAIVEAISAMAKSMKIDVTGEGVETDAQREIIKNLGCNTGQGYFYDKPLSKEAFEKRINPSSDKKAA